MEQYYTAGKANIIIQRIRFACRIIVATNTNTLRICNTYCFSAVAVVMRTRLSVTLYVRFLSCYNKKIVVLTELLFDNKVTKTTKFRPLKF
jgi:hypothetical protein